MGSNLPPEAMTAHSGVAVGATPRPPREVKNFVVCEEYGQLAVNGVCPTHGGDACLIAVGWVDNSHVRRDLTAAQMKIWAYEYLIRDLLKAWDDGGPREDRNLADPIRRLREEVEGNVAANQ